MKFLQSLSESQLLSSTTAFRKYSGRQIADLVYLHIIALRILATEPTSKEFAADYATRSVRYMGFGKWYQSATDLHLLIYALLDEHVDLKMPESSQEFRQSLYFDENAIRLWAKDIARGHINEARTKKMFLHLDGEFQMKDTSMKAIRRLVQDWPHVTVRQKQLSMTRLLQMLRVRARRSDVLVRLERLAHQMNLEMHNVNNPETGDVAHHTGEDPKHVTQKPSMLRGLAAIAGGAVLGYTAVKALSEGKVVHDGHGFVIIENPTVSQIITLREKANHDEGLRAVLEEGDLYVWDGYYMNHDEAIRAIGLKDSGLDLHIWSSYVEADVSGCWDDDSDDEEFGKPFARRAIAHIKEEIEGCKILHRLYQGVPAIQLDDGELAGWLEDYEQKLTEDADGGVTSSADIAPLVSVLGGVQRRNKKKRKKKK
jgi:hypothetical protein